MDSVLTTFAGLALTYADIFACFVIAATLFFYKREESAQHDLLASASAMLITICSIASIVYHVKNDEIPSLYETLQNVALAILFLKARGNINRSSCAAVTGKNVTQLQVFTEKDTFKKAG